MLPATCRQFPRPQQLSQFTPNTYFCCISVAFLFHIMKTNLSSMNVPIFLLHYIDSFQYSQFLPNTYFCCNIKTTLSSQNSPWTNTSVEPSRQISAQSIHPGHTFPLHYQDNYYSRTQPPKTYDTHSECKYNTAGHQCFCFGRNIDQVTLKIIHFFGLKKSIMDQIIPKKKINFENTSTALERSQQNLLLTLVLLETHARVLLHMSRQAPFQ